MRSDEHIYFVSQHINIFLRFFFLNSLCEELSLIGRTLTAFYSLTQNGHHKYLWTHFSLLLLLLLLLMFVSFSSFCECDAIRLFWCRRWWPRRRWRWQRQRDKMNFILECICRSVAIGWKSKICFFLSCHAMQSAYEYVCPAQRCQHGLNWAHRAFHINIFDEISLLFLFFAFDAVSVQSLNIKWHSKQRQTNERNRQKQLDLFSASQSPNSYVKRRISDALERI